VSSEGHPQQNLALMRAYARVNVRLYEDTAPKTTSSPTTNRDPTEANPSPAARRKHDHREGGYADDPPTARHRVPY
jgi:hypothetical protein